MNTMIPAPFREDHFELLRHGIFDDEQIDVFINLQQDFAYLCPQPQVDYAQYVPRVKKLGLEQYKAKSDVYQRRLHKVARYIEAGGSVLDIGAGDGLFLKLAKEAFPTLQVAACEKDQNTFAERRAVVGDNTFDDLDDLLTTGRMFLTVTLFHVLEHILDPSAFLANIRKLLTPEGVLMIEIPSLTCPLLSLYHSDAYQLFYFQKQHPYNYSPASLQRLMEYHGFRTSELIYFQRYDLENHLQWLTQQKPGGNPEFRELFADRTNVEYMADLEQAGQTDSVIWIGTDGQKRTD